MSIKDHARYQVWIDGQCIAAFTTKVEALDVAKAHGGNIGSIKDTQNTEPEEYMKEHTQ